MRFSRRIFHVGAAIALGAASAAVSFAQTSAIDALAAKRFGMPIISRGDNIPDFEPTRDSMHLLLIALHKGIPLSEFQARTGFGQEKIDGLLRFLESKGYAHRREGRYSPSVFIADAEDGGRLFERALPIAREIVASIDVTLPRVKELFARTGMSKIRPFEDWAFFLLSDVLLDNWQIDRVERDFLKATSRPLRHGKNYYAAFLEKNPKNEPFGIYGNQVGDVSVYGNNRWRVEAATTENTISAADAAFLENVAEAFTPRLLNILEKNRPYAEKTYADLGYAKEIAFNEFFIWWYHFVYTKATDLMAEAGMLRIPPDGNFLYRLTDKSLTAADRPEGARKER